MGAGLGVPAAGDDADHRVIRCVDHADSAQVDIVGLVKQPDQFEELADLVVQEHAELPDRGR